MISETDSVEELIERHPGIVGFLMDHDIVCIKCGEPFWGSLGELVRSKGKDVDAVLRELNESFPA
jgi:hypothetical protein